jgi:septal ring factor EnvC (AmiA/AmiB activator)
MTQVTWGQIVLPRDDEFEFNPFEWAQASAQAHAQTLQQLAEVKARIDNERDTITRLNAQLDDFIKTKNEAETALLQQFMELLNEKKRKIRDQSRLLAGAKVDKSTGTHLFLHRVRLTDRLFYSPRYTVCQDGNSTEGRSITNIETQSAHKSCKSSAGARVR